jgi:hypothetical protein
MMFLSNGFECVATSTASLYPSPSLSGSGAALVGAESRIAAGSEIPKSSTDAAASVARRAVTFNVPMSNALSTRWVKNPTMRSTLLGDEGQWHQVFPYDFGRRQRVWAKRG